MQEENYITHLGELLNAHKIKPTIDTYIIKYDLNGGEGEAPTSQIKEYGETIKLRSTTSTKKGKIFAGWATSKEKADAETVEYKAGADYTENKDVTLYAVWRGPNTIKEAKELETKFEENKTLKDEKDNLVKVPGEFHIAKDSGDTVEDGIVIEDEAGNQFVWIPVSNVDGDNDISTTEEGSIPITRNNGDKVEITLGRYEFSTSDGKETLRQSGANRLDSVTIQSTFKENTSEPRTNGGAGAKLESFVTSVETNYGYYLGRYEASFGSGDTPNGTYGIDGVGTTSIMNNQKPEVKKSQYNSTSSMRYTQATLWNFITQGDASKVCQNMYSSGKEASYVESDLVNSYAWDTAIVYIEKMGHNNYANANRDVNKNSTLKNTGETGDEVCHIYDMAGNLREWTTEYSTYDSGSDKCPCVVRGGYYYHSVNYTAGRTTQYTTFSIHYYGFRPLIYIAK